VLLGRIVEVSEMWIETQSRKEVFKKYFQSKKVEEILRQSSEDLQQMYFFDLVAKNPKLNNLHYNIFSVPNGSNKSRREQLLFKRTGLKSGVLDIQVTIPRFGYAGLWIEMKWNSTLSETQKEFIKAHEKTHLIAVCYAGRQAYDLLLAYLSRENLDEFLEDVR